MSSFKSYIDLGRNLFCCSNSLLIESLCTNIQNILDIDPSYKFTLIKILENAVNTYKHKINEYKNIVNIIMKTRGKLFFKGSGLSKICNENNVETDPITFAAINDDLNTMIELLTVADNDKITHVVDLCCIYGSITCFKFANNLREAKLTVHHFELACLGGNMEIIDIIQHECEPNLQCVINAGIAHNSYLIEQFILHNPDLVFKNIENIILSSYNLEFLFHLIKHGSNCQSMTGVFCNIPLIKNLIDHGYDFNIPDSKGYYVIHYAIQQSEEAFIQYLLNNSFKIHEEIIYQIINDGIYLPTLINEAIRRGEIEKSAQIYAKTAITNQKYKYLFIFLEKGAFITENELFDAIKFEILHSVIIPARNLITHCSQQEIQNYAFNLIKMSIEIGKNNLAKEVINHIQDVNEAKNMNQILTMIVKDGNKELLNILISRGVNLDVTGVSPLLSTSIQNKELGTAFFSIMEHLLIFYMMDFLP